MRLKRTEGYEVYIVSIAVIEVVFGLITMYCCKYNINWDTFLQGSTAFKFNVALCFVCIGIALLFRKKFLPKVYPLRYIFASLACIIVMLTLFGNIFNFILDINRDNFSNDTSIVDDILFANMPMQTAICFLCMGLSLLLLESKYNKHKVFAQYLLHFVTLLSSINLIGYIYDASSLHNIGSMHAMALHNAISFFLLSVISSFINPSIGITGIFTGKSISSIIARRVFLPLTLIVFLLGYFCLLLHQYKLISIQLGASLVVITIIISALVIIYITSTYIDSLYYESNIVRKNFKALIEASPYALIMSDSEGKILMVNSCTENLYGYNRNELIGQNLDILISDKSKSSLHEHLQTVFSSTPMCNFNHEESICSITKTGEELYVEAIPISIKRKEGDTMLSFIIDATERKVNEEIINQQLSQLQDKNLELEQFNYIASHDLQEPLRTLSNYFSLIDDDYGDTLDDEMKLYLNTMDAAVSRMSILVKSLLEFGKIGRDKKMSLTDCNIVVKNIITDLDYLITKHNATVVVENKLPVINAYQPEMHQLFQNLVNNAIKFRKKDILPIIKIGCENTNGYCTFYVNDNGIGIEKKNNSKIFHIFQRLNKPGEFEGYGIGLAHCKKIVEMHGGEIWVESVVDEGSTFKFKILNLKVL